MVVSAAGLGGLMYWVAIFPVDQVKSAMQTDALDPAQRRFPNMAVTARVRSALCLPGSPTLKARSAQVCFVTPCV